MSLKKKKKQLVAAALAALIATSTTLPTLVAAVPVAFAANTANYGLHNVFVTSGSKTSSMEVTVSPIRGSLMLDTVNYKMSPNNSYTISVTVTNGEKQKLTGTQIKQLVDDGILQVRDSRSGSIVALEQLSNGNFRVTGKASIVPVFFHG